MTMLVLPMSRARSIGCGGLEPCQFACDDSLDPVFDAYEQRAPIVDAGRDSRLGSRRSVPSHARATARRRPIAPALEDSIEPAVEQILVPATQPCERFDKQRGAIDMPAQFGFERRCAIAELGWIGHRAHVDAVAQADEVGLLFTGGLNRRSRLGENPR